MSEEKETTEAAEEAPKKKKGGGAILAVVLPVVTAALAGGGAFGGAKLAGAQAGGGHESKDEHHGMPPVIAAMRPPGPTIPMDPFLANVADANGKTHGMKLTVAVELYPVVEKEGKKEEEGKGKPGDEFKPFMPRIRDSVLSFLRSRTYEEMANPQGLEKVRQEVLDRVQKGGLTTAEKILITDFVIQ